jgi:hypothetical protein
MKELKLAASPKIKLILPDGSEYELRKPSLGESEALEGRLKEDGLKVVLELMDKLGLPAEKARELEADHLEQVLEALLPEKKA